MWFDEGAVSRRRWMQVTALGTTTTAAAGGVFTHAAEAASSAAAGANAEETRRAPRNILSRAFPADRIPQVVMPREQWRPYPAASQRSYWESLPAGVTEHLELEGKRALRRDWDVLPASVFLDYRRNGNRTRYQGLRDARRNRLRRLVMAECVAGKGTALDPIVDGIWLTCEETYWGVPAHVGVQKAGSGLPDVNEPTIDLFAAETGSLLAWTLYLLGDSLDTVSPLIRERILTELDRRILGPGLDRDDFWWMGIAGPGRAVRELNNWTPWIVSNWLTCVLLWERDTARRRQAVAKCIHVLDNFLNGYHEDGGCDEGPSYWGVAGAALFDCLELLHSASAGKWAVYEEPLIREIGRYIYRAHIAGDYFTSFADASARVQPAGDLIYRYGERIEDEGMKGLGAYFGHHQSASHASNIGRELAAIQNWSRLHGSPAAPPLVRDVWLPGTQVMAARVEGGTTRGLYLAAQGGHNAESHNHNDVGNFLVFAGGKPALIDVGVEEYTAKTFSSERYTIWTMQSAYHNLPTIGGVMQAAGREYAAREVVYNTNDERAELSLDIAKAYPSSAGVREWKRTLRLVRAVNRIEIVDQWALSRPVEEVTLTLMTPCTVDTSAAGRLMLSSPEGPLVAVAYDAGVFQPVVETVEITDSRLKRSWNDRVYRVLLRASKPGVAGMWRMVISEVG